MREAALRFGSILKEFSETPPRARVNVLKRHRDLLDTELFGDYLALFATRVSTGEMRVPEGGREAFLGLFRAFSDSATDLAISEPGWDRVAAAFDYGVHLLTPGGAPPNIRYDIFRAAFSAADSDEQAGVIERYHAVLEEPGFARWLEAEIESLAAEHPESRRRLAGTELYHALAGHLAYFIARYPTLAPAARAANQVLRLGVAPGGMSHFLHLIAAYTVAPVESEPNVIREHRATLLDPEFPGFIEGYARQAASDSEGPNVPAGQLVASLASRLAQVATQDPPLRSAAAAAQRAVSSFRDRGSDTTQAPANWEYLNALCDATYDDPMVYMVGARRIFELLPLSEFERALKQEGWELVERRDVEPLNVAVVFRRRVRD